MTTNTTSKEAAAKLQEMRDLCDEWAADSTAQAFGTPFNAWFAAKYPARYASNAVNQEAAVTIDTPEFLDLACKFAHESSCEEFNEVEYNSARSALVAHIDAELAQAREEVAAHQQRHIDQLKARLAGLELICDGIKDQRDAAEKALEAVRRGVEGLSVGLATDYAMACHAAGYEECRKDVLSLLQPQGQDASPEPERTEG